MVSDHDKQNILKKKQARIKHAISKVFVFNHEWKRKSFQTHHPTDHDIERFYQRDTFPNQRQFGRQIYQAFEDLNVTHALAVASTQSGKTGSMLAIIREFNAHNATHRVDINRVFIFTGHSSREWTTQTKKRFPPSMHDRIFHRNHFKTFIKMVQHLDNILIIFDESHIANKYGQTLYSIYNKLGFFNIKRLYSKNIKIVHFTATPDSLIHHQHIWQNSMKIIHMNIPHNYVSKEHYFHNKQLFDCKPLLDNQQNIAQLLDVIDLNNPFYHIIRTHRGQKHLQLIHDFKLTFKHMDFQYISEPAYRKLRQDFTHLLYSKPIKHTFIFIIDKLRCAKSIHVNHLQICYDRFVQNPSYDSIAQGLLGRCTGYHTVTHQLRIFTFKHIIYINSHSIHKQHNILYPC